MATFLVLCLKHLSDDYFMVEFFSCQFWGNVYCFVGILREYDVYVKPKTGAVDFFNLFFNQHKLKKSVKPVKQKKQKNWNKSISMHNNKTRKNKR